MIEHIFSGAAMERDYGYCRAAVVDGWIFVSGTAGNDQATGIFPEDVEAQTHRMLDNLERALAQAGSGWPDVVKRAIYLADPKDTKAVYSIIVERTKQLVTPASQGFAVTFLDPRIKVEMTLIAKRGAGAAS
ncbi:Rid family hydrolase [Falsiroseomonas sp.]|uniref:Rid family hydrolase n=1 Tax=Falsiroseomonas sp. TaxID=2870721 RepID=UPI003565A396